MLTLTLKQTNKTTAGLKTHHASSMKPITNFFTSMDLSVWKAIISYRKKQKQK